MNNTGWFTQIKKPLKKCSRVFLFVFIKNVYQNAAFSCVGTLFSSALWMMSSFLGSISLLGCGATDVDFLGVDSAGLENHNPPKNESDPLPILSDLTTFLTFLITFWVFDVSVLVIQS